jgi:hypothetical protein
MYDIKIFLEDNWEYWARVNAWKEIVYWVWANQKELMQNTSEWLELAFKNKINNSKVEWLFNYLYSDNSKKICH